MYHKLPCGPLLLLLLFSTAAASAQSTTTPVPVYDDLGGHTYDITTESDEAQTYFNQGLRLYYAFNHAESIRSFDAALEQDPDCAMCWWGIGLAYGPNINMPMDPVSAGHAFEHTQEAVSLKDRVSEKERMLIDALAARYSDDSSASREELDRAYADAMGAVAERFPADHDISVLYAESLMDLSPWDYWTKNGDPREHTETLLTELETVMADDPGHPGANHFYIHAVEAVDPQRAVAAAERLAGLMPGAGHIVHMPGHIYVRVGRYEDAVAANEHAVHADETYISDQRPGTSVYVAGYYPHNYDFMAFAASMIGQQERALSAAISVRDLVPVEMMGVEGLEFLQNFYTRHLQFKVRFGLWDEILAGDMRDEPYPFENAMWHYARGRALTATGDLDAARMELDALSEIVSSGEFEDMKFEFNPAAVIGEIAVNVLTGHIAAAGGSMDEAAARLRKAAELEDALVYGEPPEWSVPVRQELGRVLLAAGRPADAERAFREDLNRFPDNPWSLYGLGRALEAQGETAAAADVMQKFKASWKGGADPSLAIR